MEPVIDLDLFDPDESDELDLPSRSIWPDLRAVFAAAGATLVLLLGGAGIGPPSLFASNPIDVGVNAGFQLTAGNVYVVGPGGSGVTAYRMDGTRLWSAATKATKADSIVGDGGTVLIGDLNAVEDQDQAAADTPIIQPAVNRSSAQVVDRTVAYDASTGQHRWSGQGRAFTAAADADGGVAALVVEQPDVGRTKLLNPPSTVIGHSLRTGEALWSYQIGSQAMVNAAQLVRVESPTLLTVTGAILYSGIDGNVQVDFTTGRQSTVVGIPASAVGNFIVRIGDILLTVATLTEARAAGSKIVGPFGEDRWVLGAYNAATQELRWQTTVDAGLFSFTPCGRLICAASGNRIRALDPDTGVIRWETPLSYVVGDEAHTPGLAVGVAGVTAGTPNVAVLDTVTGRTVATIGAWQPLRWAAAEWVPLVRTTGSGQIELASLDVVGLKAYHLGSFNGSASRCQADATYLVCAVSGDRLRVWRYSR